MASSCASCGRGNTDHARACLYCGMPLRPRVPLPPGMLRSHTAVVWMPSADAAADTAGLRQLLGLDPYEASLILRGGGPRVLRYLGDPSAAAEMQAQAKGRGLRIFLAEERELDRRPELRPVVRVTLADADPVLVADGSSLRVVDGSLELVATARVPLRTVRSSSRITMLGGEPGATPGLPRVVRQERVTTDHRSVLDLYPAGADHGYRVREESTDFSGLGASGHVSALLHFTDLLRRVRQRCPEAIFDSRFPQVGGGASLPQAPRRSGAGRTVLDGAEAFARYSRLLWHAHRRGA